MSVWMCDRRVVVVVSVVVGSEISLTAVLSVGSVVPVVVWPAPPVWPVVVCPVVGPVVVVVVAISCYVSEPATDIASQVLPLALPSSLVYEASRV